MSSPATTNTNKSEKNGSPNGNNATNELSDTSGNVNPSYNPSVSSDDEDNYENNEILRGDAIGNTLYSQRFVLSTLLQLQQLDGDLSANELLENDLCRIWDMTMSYDVVMFLINNNVIEIFSDLITLSEDKRLIEILIGIIGNICNIKEAFQIFWLKDDCIDALITLMCCRDPPTLVQLLRFLMTTTLRLEDNAGIQKWYGHLISLPTFVAELSYMFYNSNLESLLHQAFRTLDAMLSKFGKVDLEISNNSQNAQNNDQKLLCELFATSELVDGTIEGFTTLYTQYSSKISDNSFLNIHTVLTQYNAEIYKPYTARLSRCLAHILKKLYDEYLLLGIACVYSKDTLDTINDIFENLNDPYHKDCLNQFFRIWKIVKTAISKSSKTKAANDFESDEEDAKVDYNEYLEIVTDFLQRQTVVCSEEQLKDAIGESSTKEIANDFINSIVEHNSSDQFKLLRLKFDKALLKST